MSAPPPSSPFPPSTSSPGQGEVHLSLFPPGTPTFTALSFTYPLKLIPSTPHRIPFTTLDGDGERMDAMASGVLPTSKAGGQSDQDAQQVEATPSQQNLNAHPSVVGKATKEKDHLRSTHCPLLFLLSYGGGLLAGDSINLTLTLDPSTRLCITTQGTTKIFKPSTSSTSTSLLSRSNSLIRSSSSSSSQSLHFTLHPHTALWYSPDPAQPFATSSYTQSQTFVLHPTASLGFIDWVIPGRVSRGEVWDFKAYISRNEVRLLLPSTDTRLATTQGGGGDGGSGGAGRTGECKNEERVLLRDVQKLLQPGLRALMAGVGVVATVVLRGVVFAALARFFTQEFEKSPRVGGREWDDDDDGAQAPSQQQRNHARAGTNGGEHNSPEGGGGDKPEHWEKREMEQEWRARRWGFEREEGITWTACEVRGCTVVKIMAGEYEGARQWLGEMLRWEGSIAREFGAGGLMFVR